MTEFQLEAADLPPREPIEYAEIPFRRPLMFLVPFLLVLIAVAAVFALVPRMFKSSTLILLEADRVPEAFVRNNVVEDRGRRLRLVKQEVLSRTRLERVLKELEPYPTLVEKLTPTELVERMRDAIEVKVKENDGFFIEYVHTNPYLAMAVTNRLATLFIEESRQAREQVISSAMQFINTQLEEAKRNLEENETALRTIRMKHMGSLPEEMLSNIGLMQRLQLELQTLSESLRSTEDRRMVLEKQLSEGLQRAGEAGTGARTVSELEAELKRLNLQLGEISSRYTSEHPEMRRLQSRIVKVSDQIQSARVASDSSETLVLDPALLPVKAQFDQSMLDIATLKRKKEDVDQRIHALDDRVAQTPQVEQELQALTRDHGKLQEVYASMLTKKTDTELSDKLEKQWKGDQFRMLDPAYLPEKPYSPILLKFLLGGLALALMAGMGTAVAAEMLDHSIKNPRELEVVLPYPLLVTVPHISTWRFRLRGKRRPKGGGDSEAGSEQDNRRRAG